MLLKLGDLLHSLLCFRCIPNSLIWISSFCEFPQLQCRLLWDPLAETGTNQGAKRDSSLLHGGKTLRWRNHEENRTLWSRSRKRTFMRRSSFIHAWRPMIKGRKLNSWKEGKRSAVFMRIKLSEIRLDSSSQGEMSRCLSSGLFPSQMTHFLGTKVLPRSRLEQQMDSFLSKLKDGARSLLIWLISLSVSFQSHTFTHTLSLTWWFQHFPDFWAALKDPSVLILLLDFTGRALQQEKQSMFQICSSVDVVHFSCCVQPNHYLWSFSR